MARLSLTLIVVGETGLESLSNIGEGGRMSTNTGVLPRWLRARNAGRRVSLGFDITFSRIASN